MSDIFASEAPARPTTLSEELNAQLSAGISDDTFKTITKKVDDILEQAQDDLVYRLKDNLADHLTTWVEEMAQRTVEQLLAGNEHQMRRYLGCDKGQWSGRSTEDSGWGRKRLPEEWHSVIHGRLFEQGTLALRKQIVDAYPELLKSQRILDLEDQVMSLVAQVVKLNREKEELYERVRAQLPPVPIESAG